MKLEDCTKADLLWLLQEIQKDPDCGARIGLALVRLKEKKCEELSKTSFDCTMEAFDLMGPNRPEDASPETSMRAQKLLKRATAARREYDRLMECFLDEVRP
jgi:hypothetical protein